MPVVGRWLVAVALLGLAGGCESTATGGEGGGGGGTGGGGTGGVGSGPDCPETYPTDLTSCPGFDTVCIYGGCEDEAQRRVISCADEGWVEEGCSLVAVCPEAPPILGDPCAPAPDGLPCFYVDEPACPSGGQASFECEGGVWSDGCSED